jgi:signal transduction histidine kinase
LKDRARDTNLEFGDDLTASDPALRVSGVQARAERAFSPPPMRAVTPSELPLISIGAPADPALLEPTYAYISAYCFACLSPQVAQRLNVAVYELYANALRYGSREGEVRLEIRRAPGGDGATLEVTNSAAPAELERLRSQIARVQEDPGAAFSGEMNRFAGASQPPPMLGIVRVAHESALALTLHVEGSRVSISTQCDG